MKFTSPLPLGPKASALTPEELKEPCIFELVCKPTGRRYIACAGKGRFFFQRALMAFYLKNLDKAAHSNVLYPIKQVHEDVKKHGASSFYIDIISQHPGETIKQVMDRKRDLLLPILGQDRIYNETAGNGSRRRFKLGLNPEWQKAHRTWKQLSAKAKAARGADRFPAFQEVKKAKEYKNSLPQYINFSQVPQKA